MNKFILPNGKVIKVSKKSEALIKHIAKKYSEVLKRLANK